MLEKIKGRMLRFAQHDEKKQHDEKRQLDELMGRGNEGT